MKASLLGLNTLVYVTIVYSGLFPRADRPTKVHSEQTFENAVARLRATLARVSGHPDLPTILSHQREVLGRYQPLFRPKAIVRLTKIEFCGFLGFKNNRHWKHLDRLGPKICADMDRLRGALGILLDEGRPVRERLNQLVPGRGPKYVPGLGRAVLTPILMISNPEAYGVCNNISEKGLRSVDLWPGSENGMPFGDQYEKVNQTLLRLATALGKDQWVLDALWWGLDSEDRDQVPSAPASRQAGGVATRATGPEFGPPINFRGLRHAPINEQGVVH